MPKLSTGEILAEYGAEPLDGSGFETEEPDNDDENTSADLEVGE
jgi:hypothetical protein